MVSLGCPATIRLDLGTENVKVAAVHYAFRELHSDSMSGEKSVSFGKSPANIVRKHIMPYGNCLIMY